MPQLVRLHGIEAEGRHGVHDEERERPQRFVVDLEIVVEAMSDDLTTTADYDGIVPVVRNLVSTESFALIETLADRIANVVAELSGVLSCRATVRKPGAAESLGIRDVSAEATARGFDR